MNFECDAFISYSHIDNVELIDGGKGWVTNLHRALEIKLSQFMGEMPRIWRDPKLAGNDIFEITLLDRLQRVAVLIAVVSPRYVKSDWTRRELTEFCKAADGQGGVRFHDKTRVFKVIKTPIPRDTDLPEFKQCLGYQFYKTDTETGRIHEFDVIFGPEAQAEFWMKLEDLAHDVCDLLQPLRTEFGGGDAPAVVGTKEAVYLAETTADLKNEREAIRRDLQQHGYTVLPSQALPLVADEMQAAASSYLSQCRMSIHPIGERYGLIPEGSEKSLTEIQNELAIERARQGGFVRLLWIPPGEKFQDERQAALVDRMRTSPRMQSVSDLLETHFEDLLTVIYERLKKSTSVVASVTPAVTAEAGPKAAVAAPENDAKATNSANGASTAGESNGSNGNGHAVGQVYLIHDERDGKTVKPYADFLFDRGFEVLRPLFQADETDVRQANEENLRVCNGALICYGAANELWVRRKVREIQKSLGYGRTDPLPVTGILSIPPMTDEKQEFRTHDCPVMMAGTEFSEGVLAPFISLMEPAGGG